MKKELKLTWSIGTSLCKGIIFFDDENDVLPVLMRLKNQRIDSKVLGCKTS